MFRKIIQKIIIFVKKQPRVWLVVSSFLILICLFLVLGYFLFKKTSFLQYFSRQKVEVAEQPKVEETPPVLKFRRLLDGIVVDSEEKINPPIFAVQVENMIDARPLSGISKADLVYEAISEAGITRLLAFYTPDNIVEEIGPVRSARPYYIDWAEEYGALYAHSGGSPEALGIVSSYEVLDLNEFSNGKYFWRSRQRYMPHNLYISTELLNKAFIAKGGEVKDDLAGWEFKDEVELDDRPSGKKEIKIYFSTETYEVGWEYDRGENDYLRYQADKIQKDKDGSEARAKNIVVQFVKMKILDSIGRKRAETIGSGEAIIFQDGARIDGTWRKEKRGARTKFFDKNGQEIKFNPGVTWVEVAPVGTEVEW